MKGLSEQLTSLVTYNGVTWHAYSICHRRNEAEIAQTVADKLCTMADDYGCDYLPALLMTNLSTGGDIVRQVLRRVEGCEKALALAQEVLDGKDDLDRNRYHLTVFACSIGSAEDDKLMALH